MPSSTNNIKQLHSAANQNAVRIQTASKDRRNLAPHIGVLSMALVAMVALFIFRLGHVRWPTVLIAEVVAFAVLPWVVYGILHFTGQTKSNLPFSKANTIAFQIGALLAALLVVIWHCAIREFGYGVATELTALFAIQSVGWYLAVFSKVPGFEKASSIFSGALVFFVCCISDDSRIFLVAAVFAFVGLWWLLGQYWSRLEAKAIDGDSKTLKLHGSAVSLTMLVLILVACIAAAIPFSQAGISLAGFMPFSGGERGDQNEFAISGIGDGNMLAAGSNATTTGAVESDQFIEDHRPSLYDIITESYDAPIPKGPKNRAISLDLRAKHLHEVKQSEKSGRTFRTMRESSETTDRKLEDRIAKALFFVEGSVPARFAINNFCQFDGWDWHALPKKPEPISQPTIFLNDQNGIPVFNIAQTVASFFTGRRTHRVTVMRLTSDTIPAPALLHQWHVPQVDKLELFRWNDVGQVRMDGESIPTHTILHLQSLVPNYHLLRENKNFQQFTSNDSRFLQIPESGSAPAIQMLAEQCIADVKPGWTQVESIVNHLRNDFDLNPNWKTDDQAEDSVNLFLEQGGGPSYMFATTCTLALRSAGYKTRVASGFLVQKQDYDSQARQSVVTARNLHMWPEVCLDGKFWIPVEPTPGHPIPYSTQTLWQWTTAKAAMIWNWFLSNPMAAAFFVTSVAVAVIFRAQWITALMFGWWLIIRTFWPQGLLKATRQLIDLRFWFSGNRRPASQTINAWYTRIESNTTAPFINLWNAENYSDKTAPASRQELVLSCYQTVNSLSLKRIRNFCALTNTSENHDTKNRRNDA